jgi:hypothetical protein
VIEDANVYEGEGLLQRLSPHFICPARFRCKRSYKFEQMKSSTAEHPRAIEGAHDSKS